MYNKYLTLLAVFLGVSQLSLSLALLLSLYRRQFVARLELALPLVVYSLAGIAAYVAGDFNLAAIVPYGAAMATMLYFRYKFPNFLPTWYMLVCNMAMSLIASTLVMIYFAQVFQDISRFPWLINLTSFVVSVWSIVGTLASTVEITAQLLPFFRREIKKPAVPLPLSSAVSEPYLPRVSLHLPCYAEPPEVVNRTLDALARLQYPNFEVLVVDNNTRDPALWRPVERHCQELGANFRFIHIEGLTGGKGGALNLALRNIDDDVDVIGVIDSDFECEPEFLSALITSFSDPMMGFVQTPHDYRDYEHRTFLRSCHWEYRHKHALVYPGMNEWNASLITGTMCLIRREALDKVGGWSESCLSEDSELALRLHAAGYTGHYVARTYGRGLVPETFYEYKKQRFRWVGGTLQQALTHWRILVPSFMGQKTHLTGIQKLIGLLYRSGTTTGVLSYSIFPLGMIISADLLMQDRVIFLPTALVVMIITGYISCWIIAHIRNVLMERSLADAFRAMFAGAALMHVKVMAGFEVLLSRKPLAWRRTSKFNASESCVHALRSASTELMLGLLAFAAAIFLLGRAHILPPDIFSLMALGLFLASFGWLAAPTMAIVAYLDLIRNPVRSPMISTEDREHDLEALLGAQREVRS